MNRKPVRILLMGDSTVWGSVPRLMAPESEPLERVVLDASLDGRLGHLPGWTGDRHPNPEGYQVIGRWLAAFLAPLLKRKV